MDTASSVDLTEIDLDAILGPVTAAPAAVRAPSAVGSEIPYAAFAAEEEAPDELGIPKSTTPTPRSQIEHGTTFAVTLQRLTDVIRRLQTVIPDALEALETLQQADAAAEHGGFLEWEIPPPFMVRLPGDLPGIPEYNTLSYPEQLVISQVHPDPRGLGHWIWHGKRENFTQRPLVRWQGKLTTAVRAVWEICARKPLPEGGRLYRTCPAPLCVRPAAPHHAPRRPGTPSGQDAYWFKIGPDGATQAERDYQAPDPDALTAAIPVIPTPRQRPNRGAVHPSTHRGRIATRAALKIVLDDTAVQPRRMDTIGGGGMDLAYLNGDDQPLDGFVDLDAEPAAAGEEAAPAPQLSSVQSLLAAYDNLPPQE